MEEHDEQKELILAECRKREGFKFYVEKTGKTMAERQRARFLR
jgi:ribosomal protein S21